MKNLFKYIGRYWKYAIVILALLVLQAYCDLSLPAYTSNIVNVGIQQSGVDDVIPTAISVEEMEKVTLFMTEEQAEDVLSAYEKNDTSYAKEAYVLKTDVQEDEERLAELSSVMSLPMMLVENFGSGSETVGQIVEQLKANIPEGVLADDASVFDILQILPGDVRTQLMEGINGQMSALPESIVEQAAVTYIKSAYEDLGIDMEKMQFDYLFSVGGRMLALALFVMILSVFVGFMASRMGATIGRDLRRQVFNKVVSFSSNEFDKFSTASLITRNTNDIQRIQGVTVMILRIVLYAPILAIGGLVRVFETNISMLWVIGLAVFLIGLIMVLMSVFVMPKFKVMQKLVDRLNLVTREILTGLPVIRAFSTEEHEKERFDVANQDLTKTNLFVVHVMAFMMPAMTIVMNGVSVLIMWVGADSITKGQMQVGDMMAFIQYTMQIIMGFLMLCVISIMLPRAAVAADRVNEVLTSDSMIQDPENPLTLPESAKGEVVFDHVSFKYPGADENVIEDISFVARPGETTAIIGSTGSGKSTVINLIPRFYDVTEGKITLDGVDVRDLKQKELRDKLGYVPQKGVLFSGTIQSNIMFGNPNGSEEEMEEAAVIAQATEFIGTKHKRYESPIAQGGSNVSGGQKQRLSIARAVAKHPDVFIFDDSFSALDYKTDVALRRALKEKTAESTVIIVAQRISTILHAEQIIVLDEGKIAGIGTHKELLKSCEVYQQIASSQLSEAELAADMGNSAQDRAAQDEGNAALQGGDVQNGISDTAQGEADFSDMQMGKEEVAHA